MKNQNCLSGAGVGTSRKEAAEIQRLHEADRRSQTKREENVTS